MHSDLTQPFELPQHTNQVLERTRTTVLTFIRMCEQEIDRSRSEQEMYGHVAVLAERINKLQAIEEKKRTKNAIHLQSR